MALGRQYRCCWWIGGKDVSELESDMLVDICDAIPEQDNYIWKERVRNCLSRSPTWLLIIDDASLDVLELLHEIIPSHGQYTVLINTSIQPQNYVAAALKFEPWPIDHMSKSDAIKLLKNIVGDDKNSKNHVYEEIASYLDYLPFALDLAGTLIKNMSHGKHPFTLEDYIDRLRSERRNVYSHECKSMGMRTSIYRVVQASVKQVQDESNSEGDNWHVQDLLRLLSFFSPEDVPLDVMPFGDEKTVNNQGAWVHRNVEAFSGSYPCAGWKPFRWRLLKKLLSDYHLLHEIKRDSISTYSVHSLLLSWANDSLDETNFHVWRTSAAAIIGSARLFCGELTVGRSMLLTRLYPHLRACQLAILHGNASKQTEINSVFLNEVLLRRQSLRELAAQTLLFEEIEIFKSRGRSRDILEHCRQLTKSRLELFGPQHQDTLQSRAQLGECLEDLDYHHEALAERESVLKSMQSYEASDHYIAAALDVAKSYSRLGDNSKAYNLLLKLVSKIEGQSRKNDDQDVLVQKRFANICHKLGYFDEALKRRKDVLRILKARGYPDSHPETCDAMTNLAHSYNYGSFSQRKKAIDLHKWVLQLAEKTFPEDHPRVLLAKDNYAWSLIMEKSKEGRAEARKILRQVLDIRTQCFGRTAILTIKSRIRNAIVTSYTNRQEAYSELKQCLLLSSTIASDEGCRIWAMQELADLYCKESKEWPLWHEALAIRIFIYETKIKELGPENPRLVIYTRHVAEILEKFCCWQAALPFRYRVVRFLENREIFDDERLRADCRLAQTLAKSVHLIHHSEAEGLFKKTWQIVTGHQAMSGDINIDLLFYARPYVLHLQVKRNFAHAITILDELRKSLSSSQLATHDEIEDVDNLLSQCRAEEGRSQSCNFDFFINPVNLSIHISTANLRLEHHGISALQAESFVSTIFHGERSSRIRVPIVSDSRYRILSLPWRTGHTHSSTKINTTTRSSQMVYSTRRTAQATTCRRWRMHQGWTRDVWLINHFPDAWRPSHNPALESNELDID